MIHKTIGIISHVDELKERIETQIIVEKTNQGSTLHIERRIVENMFIYKYHRMTTKVSGIGNTEYRFENMRDVIDKYANDGWALCWFCACFTKRKRIY